MRNFIIICFISVFFVACSTSNLPTSSNYNLNFDLQQDVSILPNVETPAQIDGNQFLKKYFEVWDNTKPNVSKKDAFWGIFAYKNSSKRKYFAPSKREYDDQFFENIKENANIDDFGLVSKPAITINNALLRNIPSHEPLFKSFSNPNDNYPFDELSNSTLGVNYPLYVSHFSKNKDFAFVRNDAVWGWVDTRDIRILDKSQIEMFKNSKFITILDDKIPVNDINDNFLFYARVGTILMNDNADENYYYGKVITKNDIKIYKIKRSSATSWPANFNTNNIKQILAGILGEPYGWGGFGYYRDCSLFTKDVMSAFGIWLPRNSKAQSNSYKSIDLQNKTNEEKLAIIKEQGIPYFSLLYMPGHIMIYTGLAQNKISATHNAWGLRTKSNGRALIGQAAITTLEIGKNQADIEKSSLLISRITKIINLR